MNWMPIVRSHRWQLHIAGALAVFIVVAALTISADAAGDLDQTFGSGGKVGTDFSGNFDAAYDMAVQADGKIVLAGATRGGFSSAEWNFGLARYNSDGSLDASFGSGGKVSTDFLSNQDIAYKLAIQSDGKIVVVGASATGNPGQSDFAIARYDGNGGLDAAFGTGGKVTTDFFNGYDEARGVSIQTDNKIVVAGTAYNAGNSTNEFAVARYNSDGTLDNTFDGDGKVTTHINGQDYATSMALYPDGRILVGGYSTGTPNEDFSLARYNTNGSLDMSFNSIGKVLTDFYGINGPDKLYALAIQPDGKIVAAGSTYIRMSPADSAFAVIRYNENGSQDPTFGGGDGTVFTKFFTTPNPCCSTGAEVPADLAIAPDGKIVVAGYSTLGNFTLTRYNNDGTPDTNFSNRGRLFTHLANYYARIYAVAIQADGKILAAGQTYQDIEPPSNFALVRYVAEPNPIPVRSDFDLDGKSDISVFRPSNGTWYLRSSSDGSVRAQPFGLSGDIIVPGDYDGDGGGTDFAVFRPSSGTWYILQSSNGAFRASQFGTTGDVPVPSDYDGDGITDVAVFRPSEGAWYILRSSDNAFQAQTFGISTDRPVPGLYDGDAKADIAVFRESIGRWFIMNSTTNTLRTQVWGANGDVPVAADYDGDEKVDLAIFRPSNGFWYIDRSLDGGLAMIEWGVAGDKPVPADFNGDFKAEVAVWRPSTGTWYLYYQPNVGAQYINFGLSGDVPTPAAYSP